jgi:hypothetical protein
MRTGYLGAAVATHLLVPTYVAALLSPAVLAFSWESNEWYGVQSTPVPATRLI